MVTESCPIETSRQKTTWSSDQSDFALTRKDEIRVGIIINKFGSSYYGRMLDGACELLIQNGYLPLVQPSYVTTNGETIALNTLKNCGCEGIIFHSDALPDSKLRSLMALHPKLVLMNRNIQEYANRCVYVDNTIGSQQAARHLLDNGHSNVAMITGPLSKLKEVEIRTSAFVDEFNRQGCTIPSELIVESDFMFGGGLRSLYKLLSTHLPFTAVFAQNDAMAMGVLEACRQKGLRVPEDLSIVGFDDHHQFAKISTPKLTTVRQPIAEIGVRTVQLMHELLAGADGSTALPSHYGRIIPELIERETVALLASRVIPKNIKFAKTLTDREVECLQWIAAGKTSGEIAIILSISESTVNFHLKNTIVKLNSSNRVNAVAKAVYHEVISLS